MNEKLNTNMLHSKTVQKWEALQTSVRIKEKNHKVTKRVFNSKMSAGNQQKFIQPLKMQANVSEKK